MKGVEKRNEGRENEKLMEERRVKRRNEEREKREQKEIRKG